MAETLNKDELMVAKRQAVNVRLVPISRDQPYQISRLRSGAFLYGCKNMDEVDAFLERTSLETLQGTLVSRHVS